MADDIDLKKTANKRPRSRSPERSGEYKRRQNRSPHRHETNVIEMKENKGNFNEIHFCTKFTFYFHFMF